MQASTFAAIHDRWGMWESMHTISYYAWLSLVIHLAKLGPSRYGLRFYYFYIRAYIICVNRSDALQTWRHACVLTSRTIIIIVEAKTHG